MAPLRCEPGDLAVVIEGACVGMFVTVVERGEDHPGTNLPSWLCTVMSECPVTFVVMRHGRATVRKRGTVPPGSGVLFCDCELQPIRPKKRPIATPAPSRELEYTK